MLWGGVDNKELLVNGTPEDVKKEVEFLVKNYGKDGGLLLGSSGQVHPACKTENVIAMYETGRRCIPLTRSRILADELHVGFEEILGIDHL